MGPCRSCTTSTLQPEEITPKESSFICVLSIKVPIRKKSGNLFNDPRIYSANVVIYDILKPVLKYIGCLGFFNILHINIGVMVIVVENGHGDTSSNPGRDCLHFT